MARLVWSDATQRFYESGVDQGVLFPIPFGTGVPWPGLISMTESPKGGEPQPYYFDGYKYLNLASAEEFEADLVAFSSPVEFRACEGVAAINNGLFATQQPRVPFNLSYRTLIGNPLQGLSHGYKIHLVYEALAAPAQKNNKSLGSSVEPLTLSWHLTTRPPAATGIKPTSHFVVDSRYATEGAMTALTDKLYGTVSTSPEFPTVAELLAIFA